MDRVTGQSGFHFLVDHDKDFNAGLCLALQNLVKAVFLVVVRRSAEEELGRQPPVGNVDGFLGLFQGDGDGPEIVAAVDIPLDEVSISLREEGFKAIRFANLGSLFVAFLLVFFVVAVVSVELERALSIKDV